MTTVISAPIRFATEAADGQPTAHLVTHRSPLRVDRLHYSIFPGVRSQRAPSLSGLGRHMATSRAPESTTLSAMLNYISILHRAVAGTTFSPYLLRHGTGQESKMARQDEAIAKLGTEWYRAEQVRRG